VHAHLLSHAGNAQPRQSSRGTGCVQCTEEFQRPVLGAFAHRDACGGAIGQHQRFRQAAVFEDVQTVGEQSRRIIRPVTLPGRRGEQRGQHATETIAAPQLGLGTGEDWTQKPVGQKDLPFPQVAETGQQFAPASDMADAIAQVARRRLLQAMDAHAPARQRAD
jgi:hypothetical protein